MHTAWHGLSTYCPTLPGMEEKYYTRKTCNMLIFYKDYKEFCNCTSVIRPGPHSERICEPMDMYRCVFYYSLRNNPRDGRDHMAADVKWILGGRMVFPPKNRRIDYG
ncbi:hypothetical protein TNIN_47861 [Trichonephila inaurata madagascariensis]|uniref:Uncharacterized protein n=1 Tax=Trichonephila inaurata madagascariensis TaxID=2747483 RepID=A0A8X6YBC3_9ARAC|nr:hypothetical protein TNIN_326401 [Trichonephila inaurata madagascariensis]GFY69686.1 hypothetical protein TNIN_47861 [Trichonephila inaurata madagascariensis]